jgi:hypothetical protein
LIAADRMVMLKPVYSHTPTAIRATLLTTGGDAIQGTGLPPRLTMAALRSPMIGASGLSGFTG